MNRKQSTENTLDCYKIGSAFPQKRDTLNPYMIGKGGGSVYGGEPVFIWRGITYGVCFSDAGYCIACADGSYEKLCTTPDSVLEYTVSGDRLRDVITQVTVISRMI